MSILPAQLPTNPAPAQAAPPLTRAPPFLLPQPEFGQPSSHMGSLAPWTLQVLYARPAALALRVLSGHPTVHAVPPPSPGLRTHMRPPQGPTLLRKPLPPPAPAVSPCALGLLQALPPPPSRAHSSGHDPQGESPTLGCPRGRAHAAQGSSPRPAARSQGPHSRTNRGGGHGITRHRHTHSHGPAPGCAPGLLTGWHTSCRVCWAWQLQGSQPRGPPRFQKRGAQRLQARPRVWGAAGALPADRVAEAGLGPRWAPRGDCAPGVTAAAWGEGGLDGTEEGTHPPWPPPHPPHTHVGSRLGAGHCRGSQAGSGHSRGRGRRACGPHSQKARAAGGQAQWPRRGPPPGAHTPCR